MIAHSRLVPATALLFVLALFLQGCAALPKLGPREASTALSDTADTRLGTALRATAAVQPEASGIYPLVRSRDAFAARALLARAADRSLDLQYYIWHGDTTGYLMLAELWDAAERGVRVRVLLDDNGIAGMDAMLAALDSHRNIEVRLFNPFANRRFKALSYVTDFGRVNRRMHNKSFTADTQATIVGGRNVGDEYFGAGDRMEFADLDVLATGRAAGDVATAFNLYWNSESAYPAASLIGSSSPDAIAAMHSKFAEVRASPGAVEYVAALQSTRLVQALLAGDLPLEWVRTHLVYDTPTKTLAEEEESDLLFVKLKQAIGQPEREVDLVSPYFVPGKQGTEALSRMAEQGTRLRILTNSLAATDVPAVHAGYAKRREPLLRSGAKIYELKPDLSQPIPRAESSTAPSGIASSSAASLHAKTFSVDRRRVFIGSLNLDPRSVRLNTEMGLVIESAKLAGAISAGLDRSVERAAYQVVLAKDSGRLQWIERTNQAEIRYDTEPKTDWLKRFGAGFLSLLPIEWLL
jgi:putative cardiolipin synthase